MIMAIMFVFLHNAHLQSFYCPRPVTALRITIMKRSYTEYIFTDQNDRNCTMFKLYDKIFILHHAVFTLAILASSSMLVLSLCTLGRLAANEIKRLWNKRIGESFQFTPTH